MAKVKTADAAGRHKLLTLQQAAEYLRLSTTTVRRLVLGRSLAYIQARFHAVLRFDLADLDEYIQRTRFPARS
jgi:excisionase family DNA binding protein